MLHDLKAGYNRHEEPSFLDKLPDSVQLAALGLLALLFSTALMWASLKFGEVSAVSEPAAYFPWVPPAPQ
ncbi:MAG: hypothetical protein ACLP7P_12180 [Rhodomicrobium sp.]